MSFLSGRKFLIVGGNGFVGNRIAAKLIKHSAHVSVLSRKGPRFEYPENKKINWIIGDAMDAELYRDKINEADTIIHSLGALFDTSVTKLRSPGEPGTYEHLNRDTFLRVLDVLKEPKTVFYLSSVNPPPFLHRYLTTKLECEQILFNGIHNGYAIRPGFIYDWKLKKWSLPLRYAIKGWNKVYPYLQGATRNGTLTQKLVKQFEQSEPTSLDTIAEGLAYVSANGFEKKIITDKDLRELSDKYQKLAQKQQSS